MKWRKPLSETGLLESSGLSNDLEINQASRVLVVEDDRTSRRFLQLALEKRGYAVDVAESVTEAWETLSALGLDAYDCVVSDYRMPERNGLELLALIQQHNAALATIIITAESEKELVTESLRGGATDFLDKPIGLENLHDAVASAIKRTRRQRHLEQSDTAVKTVGRAQERLLGAKASDGAIRVDICFYPKHEAGGDFFSQYQLTADKFCGLLTDVSGHDLQAAYTSAYFQGVVRGMLERAAPMTEIFATFNRLLLEEWNQVDRVKPTTADIKASVAACAISIDAGTQTATVLAQGMPAPVYWLPDGDAKVVGETGGFPLGWFPDLSSRAVVQRISNGGAFCLWTDGLEQAAEKQGVSELSLACALQEAKGRGEQLAEMGSAADDVLTADLWISPAEPMMETFRPLLLEQYQARLSSEIDTFQAYWQRSLRMAVPEMPATSEHDILLAAREALLNALKHGCAGRPHYFASFQIAYSSQRRAIRVRVSDFGPGHQFDFDQHPKVAASELPEEHRGLLLINQLACKVDFKRNGASVTMDFTW